MLKVIYFLGSIDMNSKAWLLLEQAFDDLVINVEILISLKSLAKLNLFLDQEQRLILVNIKLALLK